MEKILFLFFTTLLADSIYQNRLGNHVESYRLRTRSLIDREAVHYDRPTESLNDVKLRRVNID